MSLRRRCPLLAALAAATVLLAACSGGDGGNDAGRSTTSAASSPTGSTGSTGSTGAGSSTSAPAGNSYAGYKPTIHDGTKNWLCHPDLPTDECRGDQSTTELDAAGTRTVRRVDASGTKQPIDCFYVYPTVSSDSSTNSDLRMDEAEKLTVRAQVARYSSVCRVFAPAYRQITLAGLGSGRFGEGAAVAYADVLDAWKTYISQENQGRGVVLIGHSQGTGHLTALIKQEIDGNPTLRRRLISAILLGGSVSVPEGKDVGGDFKNIPACRRAEQVGCVISFASFPASNPPSEGALFGAPRGGAAGMRALCVNPAALAGGDGLADAVFPLNAPLVGALAGVPGVTTPYVSMPGAFKAACRDYGRYTVLALSPARAGDRRPIADALKERIGHTWGLHLGDANYAQDDLIEIVRREAKAFAASR